MIPQRIQIKNFLSYGSELQTIDFANYPLICLSGKNGHGKSALLDAITWAVWGRARKILSASKADEGLLRLGQTHMLVCLDFTFNNKQFRIRREFAITYGKPYAVLEFGILDTSTNTYSPLTDKTIKATQEKIESMIGLDYESFVNSAFLRQGQSNEFSQKSPKDRKEILANILGLNRFELLRKKALDKIKDILVKKEYLTQTYERIITDLNQAPALAQQAAHINQQLKQCEDQERVIGNEIERNTQEKQKIDDDTKKLELITYKVDTLNAQEKTIQHNLITTRNAWKAIHRQQLNMPDITALSLLKQELLAQLTQQQEKLHATLSFKEKLLKIKQQEQDLKTQLEKKFIAELHDKKVQHERLRSVITIHENKLQELEKHIQLTQQELSTISEKCKQLQHSLTSANPLKQQLEQQERQFEKRKNFYQKYGAHLNFLKTELQQLEQKQQFSHDDGNPSCPLCEQNLSASRKKFLKNKFVQQEKSTHYRYNRITMLLTNLKKILIDQHTLLTDYRKQFNDVNLNTQTLQDLQQRQEKITSQLQASHKDKQKIDNELQIIKKQEHELKNAIVHHEQEQIQPSAELQTIVQETKVLESHIKEIGYDPIYHQEVTAQHNTIDQKITAYNNVREAIVLQNQKRIDLKSDIVTLKNIKKDKQELIVQLNSFSGLLEQRNQINQAYQLLIEHSKKNTHIQQELFQEKGRVESLQQALVEKEKEGTHIKQTIETIGLDLEDYQSISQALGKDGIQALLIEDAIPEIEHEANQLLARLTDNQSHISIESLRDLKKGGTKETLDIKISDPMGIRPYELFSGGEAFRIDFALRIAISKLLARRAGTSLQTLIIDEGFGSQDEEGLNRMMDAIYKIQDNFSKVIIVSHLATMKDQFPVHFVIEKGSQGSSVHVIEQG